jgi:hypothetical protein
MRSALRSIACVGLALAAACGSTAHKPDPNKNVVKQSDLPARHQAVIEAWKKGGAAWELEREEVRKDPELARFVVDNLVLEMVQAFDRSRIAQAGHAPGPFERAQGELIEMKEHSTPLLSGLVGVRDGIVAFLAADTLVKIGAPANQPVVKLLEDSTDETRRRASELLGKLPPDPSDEPHVLEALAQLVQHDKSWIVRAQAARAMGTRGAGRAAKGYTLGVLERALNDEDETVAASAAQGLADLGEPRAIPRLADALEVSAANGKPALVKTIQVALAQLSKDKKSRDAAAWRAWWRDHASALSAPSGPG